MFVRRALLTSVRRAMTRVAFFADFVLAILSDLIAGSRNSSSQAAERVVRKYAAAPRATAIGADHTRGPNARQRRKKRLSGA
jgi:hypothetical protein